MPDTATRIRTWRWALLLLAARVAVLALTPAPPPQVELGWDKLNHVAALAALAALLAFGGAIELLQLQVPNRSAEWRDLGADAIGIALGAWLALQWLRRR